MDEPTSAQQAQHPQYTPETQAQPVMREQSVEQGQTNSQSQSANVTLADYLAKQMKLVRLLVIIGLAVSVLTFCLNVYSNFFASPIPNFSQGMGSGNMPSMDDGGRFEMPSDSNAV